MLIKLGLNKGSLKHGSSGAYLVFYVSLYGFTGCLYEKVTQGGFEPPTFP